MFKLENRQEQQERLKTGQKVVSQHNQRKACLSEWSLLHDPLLSLTGHSTPSKLQLKK